MRGLLIWLALLGGMAACGGSIEPENPTCTTMHNTWACADDPFDVNGRPCTEGCSPGDECIMRNNPVLRGVCR